MASKKQEVLVVHDTSYIFNVLLVLCFLTIVAMFGAVLETERSFQKNMNEIRTELLEHRIGELEQAIQNKHINLIIEQPAVEEIGCP